MEACGVRYFAHRKITEKGTDGMGKTNNILVTGNGFDLYHGLKTGYMDFVRCVEDAFAQGNEARTALQTRLTELCNRNGFFRHFHFSVSEDATWAYFESEMDNIVSTLAHFQDVMVENQKDPEYDPASYNIINGLFSYNDLQIFKHFVRVFEQIYDDPSGGLFKLRQQFILPERRLDVRALVNEVRRELDLFTEALDLYLTACVGTADADPESGKSLDFAIRSSQIAAIAPDYVINLNYTDTAAAYGIPAGRIFYAKGRAGSRPVNLVLGSPDTAQEPTDWIYLKNYFQNLVKMIGLPDRAQMHPQDENGESVPVTVHYFGYSFPDGDRELICELDAAAKKTVVYYTDREDYAQKVLRLICLFGREAVTERMYNGALLFEQVA